MSLPELPSTSSLIPTGLQPVGEDELIAAYPNQNYNAPGAAAAYSLAYQNRAVIAPAGVAQIGAFAFSYQGQAEADLSNEITDHWVESNTTVQDQIGVKSNVIILSGYVSELTLQASIAAQINAVIGTVENGLTQVDAYLGTYTPGTTDAILTAITQVQNVVTQIEQAASRAAQIASFFQAGPAMNKQQAAFAELSSLRAARILFTVYTPFQVFFNMAIMDLRAVQSEKTNTMSNFTVTMKQIQLSEEISTSYYASIYGGNAQFSNQAQVPNGITAGTPSPLNNLISSFQSTAVKLANL